MKKYAYACICAKKVVILQAKYNLLIQNMQ